MSSTFEGFARGVPMLFIPVFCDQERNAEKAAAAGNGRVLPFKDVTVERLTTELNAILGNEELTAQAKEAGRLFNDNLVHPMDEAMFWIEYVINSKGAKHLKSNAKDLYWFQYLGLDLLIPPALILIALVVVLKKVVNFISSSSSVKTEKKSKTTQKHKKH